MALNSSVETKLIETGLAKEPLMQQDMASQIVCDKISAVLNNGQEVDSQMRLIGSEASIDSMKLVEICLALEDAADELGFEFDWTSENAMSRSRSIFRTVESLASEFASQAKSEA